MDKKIFVTGSPGSGKTTTSLKIAQLLQVKQVIHLDNYMWENNWHAVAKNKREERFQKIIKQDSWIAEGISTTILQAADIIIFLERSKYLCCYRAIKRSLRYLFRSKPGADKLPSDTHLLKAILYTIWRYPQQGATKIKGNLQSDAAKNKIIFHIKNKHDLKNLYAEIESVINS